MRVVFTLGTQHLQVFGQAKARSCREVASRLACASLVDTTSTRWRGSTVGRRLTRIGSSTAATRHGLSYSTLTQIAI